jgi:hypothetical protein
LAQIGCGVFQGLRQKSWVFQDSKPTWSSSTPIAAAPNIIHSPAPMGQATFLLQEEGWYVLALVAIGH